MATNNASNTVNPLTVPEGGSGLSAMGAAYEIVCAGTTTTGNLQNVSGVGTSGYALVSQGASALPQWSNSVSSGAWVLLLTQTASSSASLAFSSTYITSTYTNYVVVISGINNASTSATLNMDWSTNNGSTYLSSNYTSGLLWNNLTSATLTNINSTTTNPLTESISSANIYLNGTFYLSLPQSAVASFNGIMISAGDKFYQCGGVNTGTTTINNIKFSYSTGNITSGSISLYGVVQ